MAQIEFVAQSERDADSTWSNTARLINCYVEPVGGGESVLKSVLGSTPFGMLSGAVNRALSVSEGVVYSVHGGNLQSLSDTGVSTTLGAITDSDTTSISSNNGNITVAADGVYSVWDGSTLATPTTGAFSDVGSVTFFKQYTVLTERNGRRVQWSSPIDPLTFNALDFATTEDRDDKNIRALPVGGLLWVFKEQSIENWTAQGDLLRSLPGRTVDVGLKEFSLVTDIPRGAFFIGSDNKAYIAAGGSMQPISTVAVETSIKQEAPERVMYYQDEGHEFCVISFSSRPSWVFDISTATWHERASGTDLLSWSARGCVNAYGSFLIVNNEGSVSRLARTNEDLGEPLIREATSRTYKAGTDPFGVDLLEFYGRMGFADEPSILLRTSNDFGNTWGHARKRTFGKRGQFLNRTTYRSLGNYQQFTAKISWADPVEITIGTMADLETS